MHRIFWLAAILTQFRPVFNRQNFDLFCPFIVGLITHRPPATVPSIYQEVRLKSGYGSLVKCLFRGKWDGDPVAKHLIKLLHRGLPTSLRLPRAPGDIGRVQTIWTLFL